MFVALWLSETTEPSRQHTAGIAEAVGLERVRLARHSLMVWGVSVHEGIIPSATARLEPQLFSADFDDFPYL